MLNKRKTRPNIVDTNVTILTLAEAVRRWTESGSFMVTERHDVDSFESKDCNIPFGSEQAQTVDKIPATLDGLDFVNQVRATGSPDTPPVVDTPDTPPVVDTPPVTE